MGRRAGCSGHWRLGWLGKPKHEILGETASIAFDRLVEAPGRHAVHRGEVAIDRAITEDSVRSYLDLPNVLRAGDSWLSPADALVARAGSESRP